MGNDQSSETRMRVSGKAVVRTPFRILYRLLLPNNRSVLTLRHLVSWALVHAISQKSHNVLRHVNMHKNDHLSGRHVVNPVIVYHLILGHIIGDICLTKPMKLSNSTENLMYVIYVYLVLIITIPITL